VHSRLKIRGLIFILLTVAACGQAFGLRKSRTTKRSPAHHARRGHLRRILWNPLFRPSHESLLRQNEEIDRLELPRIQDDAELERLKLSGDLVPIEPGETLRIDPRLDPNRRFCRPWTRDFVSDLSESYYKEFHDQIQLNSAVRTVKVQKKLRRHNRNAAPESGDTASSHLAGITVDLQRRGMSKAQIHWVEQYILPLKEMGLVEPEEERHQWVFHIAVSGRYAEWREAQLNAPQAHLQNASITQGHDPERVPAEEQDLIPPAYEEVFQSQSFASSPQPLIPN